MSEEAAGSIPVIRPPQVWLSREEALYEVTVGILQEDGGVMSTDALARALAESFWAPPNYDMLAQRLLIVLEGGLAKEDKRFKRVTPDGNAWLHKTCVQGTMQPLLLWQTGFWAVMYSCYSSGRRGDLVNMAELLSLCFVMLALLPVKARRSRSVRIKALAREAERAAKHLAEEVQPQPALFKAWPASTLPCRLSRPAQETHVVAQSCCTEVMMQGCIPDSAAPQNSPGRPPHEKQQTASQRRPVTSHDQTGPLSSTPFDNNGLADSGLDAPTQFMLLNSGAPGSTQQGVPTEKGRGEGQAGTSQQHRQKMQRKRKAGSGGGNELARKVARHSKGQTGLHCPTRASGLDAGAAHGLVGSKERVGGPHLSPAAPAAAQSGVMDSRDRPTVSKQQLPHGVLGGAAGKRVSSGAARVKAVCARRVGRSGYHGVRIERGRYRAQIRLKGKDCYLGMFSDPVSAAICYDRAATNALGADAVLNFPSGCIRKPSTTAAAKKCPSGPAAKGCHLQQRPATNGSLPADSAGGNLGPVHGRKAVCRKLPGRSGYFGVSPRGRQYRAQIHLKGKQHYLGLFLDPVTAAICYDREASRVHGTAAVLNFPPGCKPGPTPTGGVQSPVLPSASRLGQEGAATNASLPAGTPEGKRAPVPAPWPLVERKKRLGKSGFFGVSLAKGRYCAHIHLQGKKRHLGNFADPASAARRYDEEAIKAHGASAVLNFKPGGICNPTSTGAESQSPVLPDAGEHVPEGQSTDGLLPAGKADDTLAPHPGPKVVRKRHPKRHPKSGYHGVYSREGRFCALFCLKGKKRHLGTFPDPVTAAIRYDIEATRILGAGAALNFPPGCIRKPTSRRSPIPVGLGDAQRGKEGPATNRPAPAGNAEAKRVAVSGPKAVHKKLPGRCGYYGVTLWRGRYEARFNLKGTCYYLGSFPDPVTAAIRYDKEAKKACGAAAVLNFPRGCIRKPSVTGVAKKCLAEPAVRGHGQEMSGANGGLGPDNGSAQAARPAGTDPLPAATAPLPALPAVTASNADGNLVAVSGGKALQERPPGKSGYYGVSRQKGRYQATLYLKGKKCHLGTFPDPVSAAIHYDREAIKAHGAGATVNFPAGCLPNPTSTSAHSQPPPLPTDNISS